MHTDLSPHLHSEECNQLIQLLQECHKDHPLGRLFGVCNSQDTEMLKCLKAERIARRQKNFEKSLETKARIKGTFHKEKNSDTSN